MIVAHGFASSALFYVSGVIFKEMGSRSLVLNQGLFVRVPGLVGYWFLINCLSMDTPPSMNFLENLKS